jgi:hypothetical protein
MKTNLILVCVMLCCVPFCALSVQAQTPDDDRFWTTVGSDGTVDETDVSKVFFERAAVQMGKPLGGISPAKAPTATASPAESAVIRYNVTPVDGLFARRVPGCKPGTGTSCPGALSLALRFLSSGPNAQVVAKLIEVDMATGAETARLTFNSTGSASGYRVQRVTDCGPLWRFNFKLKAYYIEATLKHSSIIGGSAAGIQMIKLENGTCIG